MIRSPKFAHDFFADGNSAAGSRAGRDFIGTISTSASVKSLWTTFTLSKESSVCTIGEKVFSSCEPRSIVIGFNFVVQVARDFGDEEIVGIF